MREKLAKPSRSTSADRFDNYIKEASKKHGVAFPLLKAIMKVESDFNPRAVSKSGAKGLMQIMPMNFKALRIKDPFDPLENTMAGARYIRQLLDRFDGKLHLALAAYHAGPNKVARFKSIPPIKATKDYVKKVMKYYYIFKKG
jgi:soluble lytic murein transglycosylase